jgi:hypothetical protein
MFVHRARQASAAARLGGLLSQSRPSLLNALAPRTSSATAATAATAARLALPPCRAFSTHATAGLGYFQSRPGLKQEWRALLFLDLCARAGPLSGPVLEDALLLPEDSGQAQPGLQHAADEPRLPQHARPLSCDSVLRKRRHKMNKHKLEKRRRKVRDQGRGKK